MVSAAVVIPVYKQNLTDNEQIALAQVRRILKDYPIFFFMPESLDINFPVSQGCIIKTKDNAFGSKENYSRYMLSPDLYSRFAQFDYLLVYQLDAFVFYDKLKYYCNLGYDYIGAPNLDGWFIPYGNKIIQHTQNGGFSLRKTTSFLHWIKENQDEINYLLKYFPEDVIINFFNGNGLNLAPLDVALSFSFELDIAECLRKNNNELPFGCHAWEGQDFELLKPYIEGCGYTIQNRSSIFFPINYERQKKENELWENCYRPDYLIEAMHELLPDYVDKLYVYGMGIRGYKLYQLLSSAGCNHVCYIDRNENVSQKGMGKYPGISVTEFIQSRTDAPVIISNKNNNEICQKFDMIGYIHRKKWITFDEIIGWLLNNMLKLK